jgi:hypothetical protein
LGHGIPGLGYHFVTNQGLLTVGPPNSADAEQAIALLQLLPGMDSAVVVVSVGGVAGTSERSDSALNNSGITNEPRGSADGSSDGPAGGIAQGYVTVQQFCPTQGTPGSVKLSAPTTSLACGTSTFIGAVARDAQGGVVPDGTEINFTASAGTVSTPGTSQLSGTPTAPTGTSATGKVKSGATNVLFIAPFASGKVTITAAGGASFGTIELNISCGGATGGIIPPNTGTGIRPPNTGDGGLR